MRFESLVFPVFLGLVVTIHALPKSARSQNLFLLICSYLFYGWIHPLFCLLIGFSTAVDFFATRAMARPMARRRLLLWASVVTNLGLLSTFKYLDFSDSLELRAHHYTSADHLDQSGQKVFTEALGEALLKLSLAPEPDLP